MKYAVLVPRRSVVLALWGAPLLCIGAARAQTEPSKNAAIDPTARIVWDRMVETYRTLKTLREVIELRVTGDVLEASPVRKCVLDLAIDRTAGRAKVTKVEAGVTWLAVSDGASLQMTRSSNPDQYVKRPVDRSHATNTVVRDFSLLNVFKAVNESVPSFGILDSTLDSAAMVKQGMTSLSLGKPQVVGGTIAETLHARMTMSKRVEVAITLVCFRSDGLLSRVTVERMVTDNGITKRTRTIESHTKTVLNRPLPDSLFAFTPPPSATAVSDFD